MEEGLQGLLMGAAIICFLIAMGMAKEAVNGSFAVGQLAKERMMEQKNISVLEISEKEEAPEWTKYLEE